MPASHSDISVDLQGSLTAQKRACMLLSIYYLMVNRATLLVLQPLQMLQTCPLLSMEWIWTCGLAHDHQLAQCSLDFRSTKRALFEVLSTKLSTKRRKNEGRSKALNPNFTSTKLSALLCFLKWFLCFDGPYTGFILIYPHWFLLYPFYKVCWLRVVLFSHSALTHTHRFQTLSWTRSNNWKAKICTMSPLTGENWWKKEDEMKKNWVVRLLTMEKAW